MSALERISAERKRQKEMWGNEIRSPFEWVSILGEEYGELCQAINETYLMGQRYPQLGGVENIIKEASHAGAVCAAIPANIVCPKCGSPNYMRHLIGKGVGKLDMKCINCNSYFNFDELYKQKIAEVLKPKLKTNYDRLQAMSVEELADFLWSIGANAGGWIYLNGKPLFHSGNGNKWREWLKQEARE